jgi:hypothetical protein
MRATTAFLIATVTACGPEYRAPAGKGSDTTTTTTEPDPKCAATQTVTKDIVVDSATMSDAIPSGCWTLAGSLTIRGSGVKSLAMLGDLRGATELVLDTTALTSFDASATIAVAGPITIKNNAKLTDLGKLRAAAQVTTVDVENNANLTDTAGLFDDLVQVDGTVTIKNNAALASLELPKLSLTGIQQIGQSLTISNNAALTDIELPAFTHPNRLEISNNATLSMIGDLPITQVVSDLVITNNPELAELPAMSALTKIGGAFTVTGNQTLTSFGALPAVTYIGVLDVENNPKLTAITGLPASAQTQIYTLTVGNNAALTDLGRLSHEVFNNLSITGNQALPNCKAREVDKCTTHAVAASISGNQSQSNCTSWCGR